MKLTDENMAKALGWTRTTWKEWTKKQTGCDFHRDPHGIIWIPPTGGWMREPSRFTTSLDAIVAEIEARGLDWAAGNFERGTPSHQATVGSFKTRIAKVKQDTTAPLALCAALLAYLKETK